MRLLYFFFLFIHWSVPTWSQQELETTGSPTAYFSTIFWGKPTTRTLLYAPWGNFEDANSTKTQVRVSYGALSPKCAFYGQKNLVFYSKRNFTELELDLMKDKDEAESSIFFAQVPFSVKQDQVQEFIVLLSPIDSNGNYKAFTVPFGQNEVPWGSYKFFSRFNDTLYITAEKKTMRLEPGKNLVINSSEFEGVGRVKTLFHRRVKGKYMEVAAQTLSVSDKQRGIFFLSKKNEKVHIIPMIEFRKSLERSIGYGKSPKDIIYERPPNLDDLRDSKE